MWRCLCPRLSSGLVMDLTRKSTLSCEVSHSGDRAGLIASFSLVIDEMTGKDAVG